MSKKKAVIIFVKYPELGKVKTRLASTTSNRFAVEFYTIVSKHIFEVAEKISSSVDIFIFYSEVDRSSEIKKWVGKEFTYDVQVGYDLGEKMSNAFRQVFTYKYKNIIIIGSDVPELSQDIIQDAFTALEKNDIVISPSTDGGYSLLGMKEHHSELFDNIAWSTSTVFKDTNYKAIQKGLSIKVLPYLNDIDTEDELKRWMRNTNNFNLVKDINSLSRKENVEL